MQVWVCLFCFVFFFFFQAEDGIRDAQESRGLGDVYKRQVLVLGGFLMAAKGVREDLAAQSTIEQVLQRGVLLSLIHI